MTEKLNFNVFKIFVSYLLLFFSLKVGLKLNQIEKLYSNSIDFLQSTKINHV